MTSLDFLYEDQDCLVINKSAGMAVHLANTDQEGVTVVDCVKNKIGVDFKDRLRPGVVHRLDKDTSGVLVIAKNQTAADNLIAQFKSRKIKKTYLALVYGVLQYPEGVIDSPIARSYRNRKKMALASEIHGKSAISKYKVLKQFKLDNKYQASLLEINIVTGRTHQIRVHMAAIGHPVLGDSLYGNKKINRFLKERFFLNRQFLHAKSIEFVSPFTTGIVRVTAPLTQDLDGFLSRDMLKNSKSTAL